MLLITLNIALCSAQLWPCRCLLEFLLRWAWLSVQPEFNNSVHGDCLILATPQACIQHQSISLKPRARNVFTHQFTTINNSFNTFKLQLRKILLLLQIQIGQVNWVMLWLVNSMPKFLSRYYNVTFSYIFSYSFFF